ncbi:restriction endonuclease subunit S [Helicobacter pylori]|uniref:restriction endonuclease subunit S n=2 Tax=Helicobacter pylori TaxID=210 RepID=UPI000682619F|nr:restriction endonuclease subunit S [Helicobacter pylori]KNE05044.1 restriction endonuclease subunit S [Helicobacter pylori]
MHKIETLLQTLAPKGVEFRKLGEVCEILDNRRIPIAKNKRNPGIYPYYGANGIQDYIDSYIFDGDFVLVGEDGSVINKDNTPVVNWASGKIWVNNHAHVLQTKNELKLKFLYFYLQTIDVSYCVAGTPPKINQENLKKITIPIPPLEVQQEIVKILDAFTELNTELNARKKQYQYYQNMLLDFNGINQNHKDAKEKLTQKTYPKRLKTLLQTLAPNGVEFRKLGEVLEYDQPNQYCVTSKEFDKSYPTPVLTAGKTFILGYTNEKDNIYQASKNSPVIIFDDFTTATQWVDFPFKVKSSAMKILLPKDPAINIRFIFFYMQTIPYNISGEHTRQWISRYSQITIPIPPLEVQQEIVKILDQFSILTTDLLAGIPAEIKARKKQYEYYREKLLTFKPLTPHKEVKK